MYVCRHVEGVYYMVADFSLRCYDARWYRYLPGNIFAILAYPIGIPTLFFVLLLKNRGSFFHSTTRVKLGLLYDGYAKDVWWFEMVDMCHKLFLTSILAFFPTFMQAPTGMAVAISYALVILYTKPYYRKGDDRLHLFAQVEINLILLAAYIFYEQQTPDKASDALMSVFLILVVLGFMLLFVTQSANIVGKIVKMAWAKRKADFEKRQQDEEREFENQEQDRNIYNMSGDMIVDFQIQRQERNELASPMPRPSQKRPSAIAMRPSTFRGMTVGSEMMSLGTVPEVQAEIQES